MKPVVVALLLILPSLLQTSSVHAQVRSAISELPRRGEITRSETIRNAAADPIIRKRIEFFANLGATAETNLPGRQFGKLKPDKLRDDDAPSWLGHFSEQVRAGVFGGWRHPLSGVTPLVMSVTGGRVRAWSWKELSCHEKHPVTRQFGVPAASIFEFKPLWHSADGTFSLRLEITCRSGQKAKLVVVTNTQAKVSAAYGTVTPASLSTGSYLRSATLQKGHQTLVQLSGNLWLAQVQWFEPVQLRSDTLPGVRRFGSDKRIRVLRGLWLFDATGRPLQALYGPSVEPAWMVGLAERADFGAPTTHVTQRLADGRVLAWTIDKTGAVRVKTSP